MSDGIVNKVAESGLITLDLEQFLPAHEILLFDRLAIMRRWGELGTFDLNEVTKKMDTANRVHDCIGHLLGDLILEASRLPASSENGIK